MSTEKTVPTIRETMWFRRWEIDEMEAAARKAGQARDGVTTISDEERYVDDGSLTQSTVRRLSLRSGMTAIGLRPVPTFCTEGMSESDMIDEMAPPVRRWVFGIACLVAAALTTATLVR